VVAVADATAVEHYATQPAATSAASAIAGSEDAAVTVSTGAVITIAVRTIGQRGNRRGLRGLRDWFRCGLRRRRLLDRLRIVGAACGRYLISRGCVQL